MTDASLNSGKKWVLLAVMAGMLCMLAAWFLGRVNHPDMVVRHDVPQQAAEGGMPPAMADKMSPEIGKLMEAVGKNPMDGAALYHLAQHLVQAERWDAAESFIERAVAIEPANADRLYLLGVVQHNLNKHNEAAAALEQVVAINDDPAVRYSLGILYLYYINQPEKGREQLIRARDHKEISAELKKAILDELEKPAAPQPQK